MQYHFSARKKATGWQLLLTYKDANGKWRQKSKQRFAKKSEALAESEKRKLLESVMNVAENTDNQDLTLRELYNLFRENKRKELTYNTLKNYELTLSRLSGIADCKVTEITTQDLISVINGLSDLSPSSINLSVAKVKVLFKYAKNVCNLIKIDPSENLHYIKERRKKTVSALTQSELNSLLKSMQKERMDIYTMCAIAGYAGLRFGEIAGLTAADIDLKNKVLHVSKQYGLISKNLYTFKPVKSNNGFRDVPIPPALISILAEYLQADIKRPIDGRIFIVCESSYVNARIKKYKKDCSIHKLRHTYATLLLAHGVDVKTVAALLGDTVNTVIKTYIHYNDEMRRQAAEKVAGIFG